MLNLFLLITAQAWPVSQALEIEILREWGTSSTMAMLLRWWVPHKTWGGHLDPLQQNFFSAWCISWVVGFQRILPTHAGKLCLINPRDLPTHSECEVPIFVPGTFVIPLGVDLLSLTRHSGWGKSRMRTRGAFYCTIENV